MRYPQVVEAKACSLTSWGVDIKSAARPSNTVSVGEPYIVTVSIPSAEYSSSFTKFKARIHNHYPYQGPYRTDDDPILTVGFVWESEVTAPAKNPTGPTIVELPFNNKANFFDKEGTAFVEIDYFPRSNTNQSWARKCDTSNNNFNITRATLPTCDITGLNSCMVENTRFDVNISTTTPNLDYYYFLISSKPPTIGSAIGVAGLFTSRSGIAPTVLNSDIQYEIPTHPKDDFFFSGRVETSPKNLNRYQSVFDSLPVDQSKRYYLVVAATSGNPFLDTGLTGLPARVCAVGTFVKTSDQTANACTAKSVSTIQTADPNSLPALAGGPKTSGAGKLCDNDKGIQTAIGCVHTNPGLLVQDILKLTSGIGGGIAFLLMLLGAFRMITSQGNPQELKEGQEIFTSAIIGLLFVIFSVLFMQIIGLNILGLPGFK